MSADALLAAFDAQVAFCSGRAPFTARLLARSRAWLARDADAAGVLAAAAPDPLAAATPLRWAGALHHLALRGLEPWVSIWPPGLGEAAPDAALDDAIAAAWQHQRAHCDAALALPPQTNEVQRSVLLLPGLLHVAQATGRPLALREIGASAGLNLWCDRYRHAHGRWDWPGDGGELELRCDWHGAPPPRVPLVVDSRAGCDAQPIDLRRPDEALRLASFIWPDQPERLHRLRSAERDAVRWMASTSVSVRAARARDFVRDELARRERGTAMVLMHSVVWQYIDPAERDEITAAIEAAGATASADTPLAWLSVEPEPPDTEVLLTCRLWRGAAGDGQTVRLATAHPHGAHVHWGASG